MASYLVTGAAGFIGFHVCQRMLAAGDTVIGIDNLNPYYDPELKRARLRRLLASDRFEFDELDVNDTVR
ncbi:MAG: NAD-dependent epimerase/dehydratase family protein, partial [Pirellulaceae bacterium]|nr:NAD-dependent epimerase/dehydratase family protein [Planctomycetales bacterium]